MRLFQCVYSYDTGLEDELQVRLVGGNNFEGRVEVFYEGVWGTICDDNWDIDDAHVVCRMLGFSGAIDAPCCARFGESSGEILLDEVSCSGSESNLAFCSHTGFGVHDCDRDEDASVICHHEGILLIYLAKGGRSLPCNWGESANGGANQKKYGNAARKSATYLSMDSTEFPHKYMKDNT